MSYRLYRVNSKLLRDGGICCHCRKKYKPGEYYTEKDFESGYDFRYCLKCTAIEIKNDIKSLLKFMIMIIGKRR